MSDTSLVFNFVRGRDTATPHMATVAAAAQASGRRIRMSNDETTRSYQRTGREVFQIDNVFRNTARRFASQAALIGIAIAAAAGDAVAFTDALWPMVGALGAVPAVSVAGVAGIAALVVGFKGLGAALKTTAGGASQAADQIANAEHRIAQAQRGARDAQDALNEARETAADRLRDIQTQYARSALDQKEAAQAVKDAELALREARRSGDRNERVRAELALESARLSQVEVANRLTDVEQEYQDRMAKGVDGSDEVRNATERQADAMYELAEAQKALAQAQKGGGGANAQAEAYAKLSVAGKALVDTFHRLGPEWRRVQQATQQSILVGVADDVKALSSSYLPVMLKQLPAVGAGWNNIFRSISATANEAGFVRDMDESLGLMAVMWQRVGDSFGHFFSGFRNWVRVGADFMPRLGSWVDRMSIRWELWSAKVRATGKAHEWIQNALVTGHQFNQLLGAWGTSLYRIFALGNDPGFLQALVAGSQAFRDWLGTAEGQDRITHMWERMRDVGSAAWRVIKAVLDIVSQFDFSALATVLNLTATALSVIADNMKFLNPLLSVLVLGMLGAKVATMAATIALKGYNLTLAATPSRTAAATTAVGRFSAALGPAALLAAGFWEAYDHIPEGKGWETAARVFGGIGYALHEQLGNQKMIAAIDNTTRLANAGYDTSKAFGEARRSVEGFSDMLRAQTDPLFAYLKAQDNVNDAQQRFSDILADPNHTSAQAEQAARDLAEAQIELQGAISGLTKVNGPELLSQLEALRDAGVLSADAFNTLKAAIDKIPDEITKNVDIRLRASMDDAEWREFQREAGRINLGLPQFAGGGVFRAPSAGGAGLAVLHDREAVFTPEQQAALGSGGGGTTRVVVELDFVGADNEMVRALRKMIRVRGGNVQTALGT